ncbi:FecR family protein [Methylosinus sp. Sm6]|nr:FecR family protein [Methylosinus sp. Sm6]MBY6243806.1 FecR family protein [Methylosinus sp. Sm6]
MTEEQRAIPEEIRAAAIDWWLRRNERAPTRREQRAFEDWLAADARHRLAFETISGVCGFLGTKLPGARPIRKTRGRRRKITGAAAAGALALLFQHEIALYFRSDHATGAGETKRVTLADGSRVELDAKSAIAVRFADGERRIALIEGEAWFDVAPDPSRPFVVAAGSGAITALGTAFDVAVDGDAVRVVVGEHRVKVENGGAAVVVAEGEGAAFADGAPASPPAKTDVARATSWRRGRLIFADAPLGDVVATLARHHRGFVAFLDPSLKTRRVTGVFLADDPLAAFDEIETALGVRVTRLSNYLMLIHK